MRRMRRTTTATATTEKANSGARSCVFSNTREGRGARSSLPSSRSMGAATTPAAVRPCPTWAPVVRRRCHREAHHPGPPWPTSRVKPAAWHQREGARWTWVDSRGLYAEVPAANALSRGSGGSQPDRRATKSRLMLERFRSLHASSAADDVSGSASPEGAWELLVRRPPCLSIVVARK